MFFLKKKEMKKENVKINKLRTSRMHLIKR